MYRSTFRLVAGVLALAACTGTSGSTPPPDDVSASADDAGSASGTDATAGLDAPSAATDLGRPAVADAPVVADAPTTATDLGGPVAADVPAPPADVDLTPPSGSGRPMRLSIPQMMRRVVHARAFQHLRWTIDHETPEVVGRALASLRPTYVSGLVRLANDETLSADQVRDFNTIRRLVREASPSCQFDVVLNAQQYETPAALHPDAWFFDFYYSAYTHGYRNPLDQAVEWSHDNRQYIGGNTTGDDNVPRSDFAALSPVSHAGMVADGTLDLKRDEILRLHRRGFPVLMHINNDPHFAPTTESCYFMGVSNTRHDWGYNRRVEWITERVRDQSEWHFHFMYPVFFPECPIWHSYDALRDGMMMSVFVDLMRRFN